MGIGSVLTAALALAGVARADIAVGDATALRSSLAPVNLADPTVGQVIIDPTVVNTHVVGRVRRLEQVNHFVTGFDEFDVPLAIPTIDPAGVTYNSFLGALMIADSEIPEIPAAFSLVGATLFAIPTNGGLTLSQWDLTEFTGIEPTRNRESTGVVFCENDGYTYVTNDDTDLLYRYEYDGASFSVVDFVSTRPQTFDPEGVTCDPQTGLIYVVGGIDVNLVVYRYNGGFELVSEIDLNAGGDAPVQLSDAEGVAFDALSGHLFVVSDPAELIVEYDLDGRYVNNYPVSGLVPEPIAPQGITVAPSSADPERTSFYIVDGGLDNDQVPSERDGAVYELLIHRVEPRDSQLTPVRQSTTGRTTLRPASRLGRRADQPGGAVALPRARP